MGCRCVADHEREGQFPFLDENVVTFLQTLPSCCKVRLWELCFPTHLRRAQIITSIHDCVYDVWVSSYTVEPLGNVSVVRNWTTLTPLLRDCFFAQLFAFVSQLTFFSGVAIKRVIYYLHQILQHTHVHIHTLLTPTHTHAHRRTSPSHEDRGRNVYWEKWLISLVAMVLAGCPRELFSLVPE